MSIFYIELVVANKVYQNTFGIVSNFYSNSELCDALRDMSLKLNDLEDFHAKDINVRIIRQIQ